MDILRSLKRHVVGISFVVLLGFAGFQTISAQKAFDLRSIDKPLGCEESFALQGVVISEAIELLNTDAILFLVVSPGNNEKSRRLTQQSIIKARNYLSRWKERLKPDRVRIVEGVSTAGNGRLEYFINGELYLRLMYPKKGYICHE